MAPNPAPNPVATFDKDESAVQTAISKDQKPKAKPTSTPLGPYATLGKGRLAKTVRAFGPGARLKSRDGRTEYGVGANGAFVRLTPKGSKV
jgi:hypothetical protein